jgi:hypothetical protein
MRWCWWALVIAFSSGCWTSSQLAEPTPAPLQHSASPVTARPRSSSPTRLPPSSQWSGSYLCPQGPTALTLTIDAEPSGKATALFEFGPLATNPSVPTGSYWMTGEIDVRGGSLAIALEPDRWIVQPPGYVMVGLEATSESPHRELHGSISERSCGELHLTRVP